MNTLAIAESELSRGICVSTGASTGHCHFACEVGSIMIHRIYCAHNCSSVHWVGISLVPDVVRLTHALSLYHCVLFEQLQ